jgi:hypothetical protein
MTCGLNCVILMRVLLRLAPIHPPLWSPLRSLTDREDEEGAGEEEQQDYMQEDNINGGTRNGKEIDHSNMQMGQSLAGQKNLKEREEGVDGVNSQGVEAFDAEMKLPEEEAHRALADIPKANTRSRKSKRRADTTAELSMERAERLKAARNLDFTQENGNKNTSHASFLQFPNEIVVDNLNAVGISLGNSKELVSSSVACVKEVELKRFETTLIEDRINSVFDREEKEEMENEEVDKLILSSLCSEIMDEVMDLGNAYSLDCEITSSNKSSSSPKGWKKPRRKSKNKGSK